MLKYRNLISKFNLVNGKMEWYLLDENYDYQREIQSSGYADMLNDCDRNRKYYNGLRTVISEFKKSGKRVHVLDIGCGSGILSMMALKLGADKVTACETFKPMIDCAERVLKENGLWSEKMDLVNEVSTNLKIGVNMKERANVLVSEIFDSELIGEGVLPVFEHAIKHLLTEDAKIIPFSAELYIQPVKSNFLRDHNILKENKYIQKFPNDYYTCSGYSSGFDIQASSLIYDDSFEVLSSPILVKVINFKNVSSEDSKLTLINLINNENITSSSESCLISISKNSMVDAFIFWWKLVMTHNSDIDIISTAPKWTYEFKNDYKWRDHWLQVALFSSKSLNSNNSTVKFMHDTYSIWISNENNSEYKPRCTCGLHIHISRSRIYQLNCAEYNNQMKCVVRLLEDKNVKKCLVISDFSYLPLYLADRGINTHNIIDNDNVRQLTQSFFITFNTKYSTNVTLSSMSHIPEFTFDAVISEPFFVCSLLPWDNIHFWYTLDKLRKLSFSNNFVISPNKMTIKAVLVEFDHLHKIGGLVGRVENFDLSAFDHIIQFSNDEELHFESRSLWEYDCYPRSDVGDIITFDLMTSIDELLNRQVFELTGCHTFKFSNPLKANAIVMWTCWQVYDCKWIDNNVDYFKFDHNRINWKPYMNQAVHFLNGDLLKSSINQFAIKCCFNLEHGRFKFTLNL